MSNLIRLTDEERLVLATLHGACAQAATHARSSLLTRLAVVLDELERGDVEVVYDPSATLVTVEMQRFTIAGSPELAALAVDARPRNGARRAVAGRALGPARRCRRAGCFHSLLGLCLAGCWRRDLHTGHRCGRPPG